VLIHPDPAQARREQLEFGATVGRILRRGGPVDADLVDRPGVDPRYPGACELSFVVQAATRGPVSPRVRERHAAMIRDVATRSTASIRRASESPCASWPVDLAPVEPHLRRSLSRAEAKLPSGRDVDPPGARLAHWRTTDRETMCATGCLLRSVWPQMLAELAVGVRQIALIQGTIGGFSDFVTHGAVFVDQCQLDLGDDGRTGQVRLAEALVHEGAHVRAHAATFSAPFLVDMHDESVLVRTPLRSDPRPLNGLFQQLLVLTRCALLYDRILAASTPDLEGRAAVRARRDLLYDQGRGVIPVLREHRGALTDRGAATVEEAAQALANAPSASASR
jgi:HEXXH motif-containing protein